MTFDETTSTGVNAYSETVDRLDEIAERWDGHSPLVVKRSVPARQALHVGTVVLEMAEEEYGTAVVEGMDVRDLEGMIRQGMLEYFKQDEERHDGESE